MRPNFLTGRLGNTQPREPVELTSFKNVLKRKGPE